MKWFKENWGTLDKIVENVKLLLFGVFVISVILFILTLLIAGFDTLFGTGGSYEELSR